MERSLKYGSTAFKVNMGGILLDQALPSTTRDQIDPFLLIHHLKNHFVAGDRMRDHGVGPHPHRGFSPVSFIVQGAVTHQDSRGNHSVVQAGGVQWMNSGLGIVHSERPSQSLLDEGGVFELIQIWINSPAEHKMEQPEYFPLQADEIPKWHSEMGSTVKVVAGEFAQLKASMPTKSPMNILWVDLKMGDRLQIKADSDWSCAVYIIDGGLALSDGSHHFTKDLLEFNRDGELVSLSATADCQFLWLSGAPLDEPLASQGPFVMNTETQILQAIRDYQMGKMGILVEEF